MGTVCRMQISGKLSRKARLFFAPRPGQGQKAAETLAGGRKSAVLIFFHIRFVKNPGTHAAPPFSTFTKKALREPRKAFFAILLKSSDQAPIISRY